MGYTKGQWKVTLGGTELPENQRIIQAELGKVDGIMEIRTICKTFDYGEPAEMVANAHLISAAPDMLEALKLLQSALTEYRLRDVKKRYSLCVADGIASNAIFKAEGGK